MMDQCLASGGSQQAFRRVLEGSHETQGGSRYTSILHATANV